MTQSTILKPVNFSTTKSIAVAIAKNAPAGPMKRKSILAKLAKIADILNKICPNFVNALPFLPTASVILPDLPINALKLALIPCTALLTPTPFVDRTVNAFCKPFIIAVTARKPANAPIATPTPASTFSSVCNPSVLAAKASIDDANDATAPASPSKTPVSSPIAPNNAKNDAFNAVNDSPIVVVVLPKSASTLLAILCVACKITSDVKTPSLAISRNSPRVTPSAFANSPINLLFASLIELNSSPRKTPDASA